MLKAITALYGYKNRELTLAGKFFRRHGAQEQMTDLMKSSGPTLVAILLRDNDLLCESGFGVDLYNRGHVAAFGLI